MFMQPHQLFPLALIVVTTLQSLGVHMTSCHLWLTECVGSVIYCYIQLSMAAKHSLDTFTPLCPDETSFPRIVHRVWRLNTAPNEGVKRNQTKWRCGIFSHSQSSPLGYPGLKVPLVLIWPCSCFWAIGGNWVTPRQALVGEENSTYKNPELRSHHICVMCFKSWPGSPISSAPVNCLDQADAAV